jgi:hypothetical protein
VTAGIRRRRCRRPREPGAAAADRLNPGPTRARGPGAGPARADSGIGERSPGPALPGAHYGTGRHLADDATYRDVRA